MKNQNLRKGQPLPEQIDGHELTCFKTMIPDHPLYIAAVHGIFKKLEHYSWWEKSGQLGDTRASEAALYWRTINNQHIEIGGECAVMPNPVPAGLAVGMVIPYAGTLPLPDGLLLCDGTMYDGALYPELYSIIHPSLKNGPNLITPDMGSRVVMGYDTTPDTNTNANNFNQEGGESTAGLSISMLPAHNHTLPLHTHPTTPHTHLTDSHGHTTVAHGHGAHQHAVDARVENGGGVSGTPALAYNIGGATTQIATTQTTPTNATVTVNNTTVTVQNASVIVGQGGGGVSGSEGSGVRHNNLQPYRVLYYVIVAKKIVGDLPKEVVMSSTTTQSGKCKKLYWRYADEPTSANRFLFEVCNGEDGATGEKGDTGSDGTCPECDEQVPAPQTETPQGCKVSTGIVEYVLEKYIEVLSAYIEQVVNNGVSLIEFGEWARRIIFYNGNPATAIANLIAWIAAQQAQGALDNLNCANDAGFKEDLICSLYCVMPLNGNFDDDVFADWKTKIGIEVTADCKADFLNFLSAMLVNDLRVEALAAIEFGIDSDCSGCPCGCTSDGELLATFGCKTPIEEEIDEPSVVGAIYRLEFSGTYTRDGDPGVVYDWFYTTIGTGTPFVSPSQISENVPSFEVPPYNSDHIYVVYVKGNGLKWTFKRYPRYEDCHGATTIEVLCYNE